MVHNRSVERVTQAAHGCNDRCRRRRPMLHAAVQNTETNASTDVALRVRSSRQCWDELSMHAHTNGRISWSHGMVVSVLSDTRVTPPAIASAASYWYDAICRRVTACSLVPPCVRFNTHNVGAVGTVDALACLQAFAYWPTLTHPQGP